VVAQPEIVQDDDHLYSINSLQDIKKTRGMITFLNEFLWRCLDFVLVGENLILVSYFSVLVCLNLVNSDYHIFHKF